MQPRVARIVAALWGLLALCVYLGMARFAPWDEYFGTFLVLYVAGFLACWGAAQSNMGFLQLIVGAVVFRALLVPLEPTLSDDIFRYVWEGRVQLAGFDPYVLSPSAPELAALRDPLWTRINHPEATAIYPPLAQLAFRAMAAGGGVTLFKAIFAALDMGIILLLAVALRSRGAPLSRLALYAWNPLAIVEIAGSGHLEPLAILPFLLAIIGGEHRKAWAWCALAASLAVKYSGAWAAPFLFRARRPSVGVIVISALGLVLVMLPFVRAGWDVFASLQLYAAKWRYNDLLFMPLPTLTGSLAGAKIAAGALLLAILVILLRRKVPLARGALLLTASILLFSPTVHPWYLLWLAVLLPLTPSAPLFLWSGSIVFAYLFLFDAFGLGPCAQTSFVPRLLQMIPVLLGLFWVIRGSARARARALPAAE